MTEDGNLQITPIYSRVNNNNHIQTLSHLPWEFKDLIVHINDSLFWMAQTLMGPLSSLTSSLQQATFKGVNYIKVTQ
jgi:hypothetical protein